MCFICISQKQIDVKIHFIWVAAIIPNNPKFLLFIFAHIHGFGNPLSFRRLSLVVKLFSYLVWDAYLFVLFLATSATDMKEDIHNYSLVKQLHVLSTVPFIKTIPITLIKVSDFLLPKELKNTFLTHLTVI